VPDRIVVVGAGVVGAATALELARQGEDVLLLEADGVGAGVSGGSLAALSRHHVGDPTDLPFVVESTERWAALAREFHDELGIDVEYEVTGQLSLVEADSPDDAEQALAEAGTIVESETTHGLRSELISANRARELVPALRGARVVGATWAPDDAKINALVACRALVHAAVAAGAQIRTATRVERLIPTGGRWDLETSTGRVSADVVIVAGGPWTAAIVGELEPRLAELLRPKRAQCCITDPVARSIDPVVASISVGITNGYTQLHQTRTGHVMFNTVCETADPRRPDGQLEDHVDHDFLVASARQLVDLFPHLARARLLRAWGACEAWTADQRFLIGPVGPQEGLFVAAGDSGTGFLRAPMVAHALWCLIRGRQRSFDTARYEPLRNVAPVP
jgi:glycine/D-amino acid oxidase-like deaminating enzyme